MIAFFAAHRTAGNLLMAAILLLGLVALPNLRRDTFPEIPASEVEIRVVWPGASPRDVEDGLCLRLEDPLRAIADLKELRCDAREGVAILTAEKRETAAMEGFYADVKSAVDGLQGLPDRARTPTVSVVERISNVATVAVTAAMSPVELHRTAENLRQRLLADPSIAQATLKGFSDREIAVEVEAGALRRLGLTVSDIADAVGRHSLDMSAGALESDAGDVALRFTGERRAADAIAAIPVVSAPLGGEVALGDVATVTERFSEPHLATFFDGERAALIQIAKTDAQDALKVRAALEAALAREQARAPEGVTLRISADGTTNITDRLRILTSNGAQGLVAVFLVMWLFFGLRLSFWVAAGLPVAFLGAIFAMQMLDLSINMITMVALLVAIGLLMDDAIVLSENIVARRQKGDAPLRAAIEGAREVAPGVISSFLTTIMIVGPLALMQGNMGAVLKFMPIVLVITLAVSLVEAFLVLPHHLKGSLDGVGRRSRVHRGVDAAFVFLRERMVGPLVDRAIRWRYLSLGLILGLLVLSAAPIMSGALKFSPFPPLDSDVLEARILLPQGTPLARTEKVVARVEQALAELDAELTPLQPEGARLVRHVTVQYGVNADAPESGPHLATVSVDLLRAESRSSTINEMIALWRRKTGPVPDAIQIKFTDRERGPAGKPLEIMLKGDDLAELSAASRAVQDFIWGFAGIRDLTDDLRPGDPELSVSLRPGAAGALGVSARSLADQMRAAFRGDTDVEIQDAAGAIDVMVRLARADRLSLSDVLDLPIRTSDGTLAPLSAVADVAETRGWARILRIDGRRTVTVEGNINPRIANAREILAAVQADLAPQLARDFPDVEMVFAGEAEDTAATGASLQVGVAVGLAGVFAILALQFGSFLTPVAVIVAIPLGLVGVIWGHVAMGLNLTMPSMVGLATLGGIVVNNAILLIAFMRARIAAGESAEKAAGGAARDRLRAILLTSITTIAGLTPMLLETSTQAQLLVPLVASLAFGLSSATLLALFATPVTAVILGDLGHRMAAPSESYAESAPDGAAPA